MDRINFTPLGIQSSVQKKPTYQYKITIIFSVLFIIAITLFFIQYSKIKKKYNLLDDTFINSITNLYKNKVRSDISGKPTHTPTSVPIPTGSSTWVYQTDANCNVKIPIPPRIPPYYIDPSTQTTEFENQGSIWYFETQLNSLYFFTHHMKVGLKQFTSTPTEDSAAVHVYCTDKKLFQNEVEMAKAIQYELQKTEKENIHVTLSERRGEDNTMMTVARFSNGKKYYLLTKNDRNYLIMKETKIEIKRTTDSLDEVFDRIVF